MDNGKRTSLSKGNPKLTKLVPRRAKHPLKLNILARKQAGSETAESILFKKPNINVKMKSKNLPAKMST